ncbi:MAG: twin-arginine translocation signal domain-containing protein, partial [Candidatus Binatia bacterium]
MNRRDFLRHGLSVSAGVALSGLPRFSPFARANDAKWRTFEITSRIEIADPVGASRAWVPVPLMNNTDYFKREPDSWDGNYKTVRQVQTDNVGTGLVFAEWAPGEKTPTLEVKSRFMTQDRWVDLSQKPNPAIKENKAVLDYFRKPTKYIRTDGIVATTSKGIVTGYKN